ncbi:unnamed protein product [Didymodactylos carnosus]|uniref:Uncharacterized protein n=1 Tax=Didymodactylos carnosus TaxID=1234261 RepID=A0A814HMA2_9BILA|nr:unnamed protein product [Didymodactylos carnosus]CAF1011814.1 unnamed protein product [Didymodactylos carnosus]CAF3706232.1 unnamed protein product [Didymodactylos carnosus]CAF3783103.1 unnamed protein product [Didymodactylos carnosus]
MTRALDILVTAYAMFIKIMIMLCLKLVSFVFLLLFSLINCSDIILKLNYPIDSFYPYYQVVHKRSSRDAVPIFNNNDLDDKLSMSMFHDNDNSLPLKNFFRMSDHDHPAYLSENTTIIETSISHVCDDHIYDRLYGCSANEHSCHDFLSCVNNIHCPPTIQSHSGLIINLMKHLGMNNCEIDALCPHDKRLQIFIQLLTRWTTSHFTDETNIIIHNVEERNDIDSKNYCNTISELIVEVNNQVEQQCPAYLNTTKIFTDPYYCRSRSTETESFEHSETTSTTTIGPIIITSTLSTSYQSQKQSQVKIRTKQTTNSRIKKLTTTRTITTTKFKEYDDDDLDFINLDKLAGNSTEQSVFVNDHLYYNVSYIVPKLSTSNILNFVRDNDIMGQTFSRIHALSDKHRSAFGMGISFPFPFYGHTINRLLVATGGFLYTGELVHAALIGSTQYIAPFMSNFDTSLGDNESEILHLDNGTHFIITWNKVYLQDQQELGPYTFQVILQDNGNIYFNYNRIPTMKVSEKHHTFRVGLSDAFMLERPALPFHVVRIITLYHKIDIDRNKIQDGTSVVFEMDTSCNTFTDCTSCLANHNNRYNCSWCDDVQRCSDGYDRLRNEWLSAQCHRTALKDYCSVLDYKATESSSNKQHISTESSIFLDDKPQKQSQQQQQAQKLSINKEKKYHRVRTAIFTLIILILVGALIGIAGFYIYAYKHPTSTPGMWLIEHRPQHVIARFKRLSHSNDTSMTC